MLRIGLTGGIGSGKTFVCSIFESLGVHIYNADARTKLLYSNNVELKEALILKFGPTVYIQNDINKPVLANLIFNNPTNLAWLNALVHPLVFKDYEDWCLENENEKYTIKEAAILFESGSYAHVHKTIGVIAPMELRIQRIIKRDNLTVEDIEKRIAKQLPEKELIAKCDYIINNNLNDSVIKQVLALHKIFNS